METIQLCKPSVELTCKESYEQIDEILASGRLTEGKWVQAFEKIVARQTGADYVVTAPNGTAALTIVFRTLRHSVGPYRDEVIMPAFTFSASLVAVLAAGFTPRFVDVLEDGTIDPEAVLEAAGSQTAAILAVDTFGLPCHMDELRAVQQKMCKFSPIIVDSAQAFGAVYKGKPWGSQGDVHVFSFAPSKVVTCGEGGAITFSKLEGNEDEAEAFDYLMRSCKNYGFHDKDRKDLVIAGHNGRLPELSAFIGCQSGGWGLEKEQTHRQHVCHCYYGSLDEFQFMPIHRDDTEDQHEPTYSSLCYCVIRVKNRDYLQQELADHKIESKPYFSPLLTSMSCFRGTSHLEYPYREGGYLNNSRDLAKECLAIPCHSHLSDDDLARVCSVIREYGEPA